MLICQLLLIIIHFVWLLFRLKFFWEIDYCTYIHLIPINNDVFPADCQSNGQFEGDTLIGTVNMGDIPDKKKWLL